MNKVLIGTIFSDVKDYVILDWYDHVCKFTFPGFDVCAIDNSKEKKYHKEVFNSFKDRSAESSVGNLTVLHTTLKHKRSEVFMAFSANELRNHFLINDYDWLLYLECDIFPPLDIIERLLCHNKQIISALFFTGSKATSYPMIAQTDTYLRGPKMAMRGFLQGFYEIGETEIPHPVASAGLGCVLMYKEVMQNMAFRPDDNLQHHHDTVFMRDLFEKKVPNFYVPVMCMHENQTWDIQRKLIGKQA